MENNLSLYHIFLSVANHGNITKAAEELFISQPAISKAIQKLEENLGVPLFIRSTRGVKLTYEGTLLYEEVSKAFHSIRIGEEQIKQSKDLGIGHLTIGVSTTLCKYVLLPYLKKYIENYPHVRVSIACQSTHETLKLLDSGKIDIGLVGRPTDLRSMEFHTLKRIEDIFVATSTYQSNLKMHADYKEENPLESATLMLLDKENITRQYVDDYLHSSILNPSNLIEVTSMDLLIEFAKISLGIACVIKDFVQKELATGELIEFHTPINIPKREIGFIYKSNALKTLSVRNFISFMED